MGEDSYDQMQDALARMVRDFGPTVSEDPARVRSVLSDLLGDGSIALRGEIDAVVLAAEAGVPAALAEAGTGAVLSSDDTDALVDRVKDRGATPERAGLAVKLWSSSLGASVPATELPAGMAPATEMPGGAPATDLPEAGAPVTELPDGGFRPPVGVLPPPPPPPPPGTELPAASKEPNRRPIFIGAAAAVAVLALVAGVLVTRGGGGEKVKTAAVSQEGPSASLTTTTSTTTTTTTTTTVPADVPVDPGTGQPGPAPAPYVPKTPTPGPDPTQPPVTQPPVTQPPVTQPPTTLPPAPVATSGSYSATAAFFPCGSSYCHGNVSIPLSSIAGGTYNRVTFDGSDYGHGDGSVSGGYLIYKPHHQGSWYDVIYFTVWDDTYGRSESGYYEITIYCNTDYTAYEACVNYL